MRRGSACGICSLSALLRSRTEPKAPGRHMYWLPTPALQSSSTHASARIPRSCGRARACARARSSHRACDLRPGRATLLLLIYQGRAAAEILILFSLLFFCSSLRHFMHFRGRKSSACVTRRAAETSYTEKRAILYSCSMCQRVIMRIRNPLQRGGEKSNSDI